MGPLLSSFLGFHLKPELRRIRARSLYFDITRAKTELRRRPRWSNDEMLCQSYDWYLAHKREILSARPASAPGSAVRQGIFSLMRRLS